MTRHWVSLSSFPFLPPQDGNSVISISLASRFGTQVDCLANACCNGLTPDTLSGLMGGRHVRLPRYSRLRRLRMSGYMRTLMGGPGPSHLGLSETLSSISACPSSLSTTRRLDWQAGTVDLHQNPRS